MVKKLFPIVAAALLVIGLAVQATAKTITLGSSFEYSGGTAPVSVALPWLTTAFDDGGGTGSIILTLSATNLIGSEFVSSWYLNVFQESQVTSLSFSAPTKTGDFADPTISLETNGFKADGDGKFDILLSSATSDGVSTRFTAGDSVSYVVSGIAGLSADSFNVLSSPAGGKGPFTHAEHVQSIGSGNSGWVSGPGVPEPSSILALLGGVGSLFALRRRARIVGP